MSRDHVSHKSRDYKYGIVTDTATSSMDQDEQPRPEAAIGLTRNNYISERSHQRTGRESAQDRPGAPETKMKSAPTFSLNPNYVSLLVVLRRYVRRKLVT